MCASLHAAAETRAQRAQSGELRKRERKIDISSAVGQPVDIERLRPGRQLAPREIARDPFGERAPIRKTRHFPGTPHGARIIGIDLAQVKVRSGLNHCFLKVILTELRVPWPR